jgi:hypothetical protein
VRDALRSKKAFGETEEKKFGQHSIRVGPGVHAGDQRVATGRRYENPMAVRDLAQGTADGDTSLAS